MITRKIAMAAVFLALIGARAGADAADSKAAEARPRKRAEVAPRLVVVMIVDGLAWAHLEYFRPWYRAGLQRLLDEGLVFAETNYRHLNTETGPGHASLATGAPPRVHGIIGNSWLVLQPDGSQVQHGCTEQPAPVAPGVPPLFYLEEHKDGALYVFAIESRLRAWRATGELNEPVTRPATSAGAEPVVFDSEDASFLYDYRRGLTNGPFTRGTTAGPDNLRVDTLGDRLVATRPTARVVALSAKDRASLLTAGRNHAHGAYWFDVESGRFVDSAIHDLTTEAAAASRTIVDEFNRNEAGGRLVTHFGTTWKRLAMPAADSLPPPSPYPADLMSEFQVPSNGLLFDHDIAHRRTGYFASFYATPWLDELIADLAIEFIRDDGFALGRRQDPDLLTISFTAHDPIAHTFGPRSEEHLDTLRRLDLQIARVLGALDAAVGKGGYVVAFSADHGFDLIPEAEKRINKEARGGRLVDGSRPIVDLTARLNRALRDELCLSADAEPIASIDGANVFYRRPAAFPTVSGPCGPAFRVVGRSETDAALPRVLRTLYAEEIAGVYPTSQRDRWPASDPITEFLINDYDAERSGDAMLVTRPGVIIHWDPARGTGHGSMYEPDTHVPLIFFGGPFAAGNVFAPSTPYDLAPTLAALLGVSMPNATGRNLRPVPAMVPR